MGHNILRVPQGTVLTPKQKVQIQEIIGSEFQIECYDQKPDYRRSIQRRMDSLHEAFLFILEAYPPNSAFTVEVLTQYIAQCKSNFNLRSEHLNELQAELVTFTEQIVEALILHWNWPNTNKQLKEAIHCLNKAEQYVLMKAGRPDVATLIPLDNSNKKGYVLQFDKSLPPHYPQLIEEINVIKCANFPKTPAWFYSLKKEYQQAYLCSMNKVITGPEKIIEELNNFIDRWNMAKHIELPQIKKNQNLLSPWFDEFSPSIKNMMKILIKSPDSIDASISDFKKWLSDPEIKINVTNFITEFKKIPQWYLILSSMEQSFHAHVFKATPSIEEAISFLPSRHRTIPAPANYGEHSLYVADEQEGKLLIQGNKRKRSAHMASRDIRFSAVAVQQRHAESGLAKVMEDAAKEKTILVQTLISPLWGADYLPQAVVNALPPDLYLEQIAHETVKHFFSDQSNIVRENHPLNYANRVWYTSASDTESLPIFKQVADYIKKNPNEDHSVLNSLLTDYKNTLNSGFGTAVADYGRELHLSSLEQLIVMKIKGYVYGSCVSGKDRKGIELLYTDAMLLFYYTYGTFPQFNKTEGRAEFVALFAKLYCSRHQQEMAGQNAPGADGIKTPYVYLPQDIKQAITKVYGELYLNNDDVLASNNEVKEISKFTSLNDESRNLLKGKLFALVLGDNNCSMIYNALSSLTQQGSQFSKKKLTFFLGTESKIPTGIVEIKKIMEAADSGSNRERVAKIETAILQRPETNSTRTAATNSVYNGIRKLYKTSESYPKMDAEFDNALKKELDSVLKEWVNIYEHSKVHFKHDENLPNDNMNSLQPNSIFVN